MNKQCCIVIPVYKEELDCIEKISLKRLYTVLGNTDYDIFLVCPDGLNCNNYYNIFNTEDKQLLTKYFDLKYFISTASYSQLCISYNFYKAFEDYDYMMIYQLDCYLFRDDIAGWCNMGYDYVGAPIISTDCGWDTVKKHNESETGKWQPYVGNGGLSLRKISVFMDICDPEGELRQYYKLTDELLSKIAYEDKYFCNDLFDYYKLNIPDWKIALNFAFDMSVDVIYNFFKWEGKPMGIHSVDKNIRWWKKVLPEFADQSVIDYCEEKHKEFFKLYYDENDSTMR